nr:MAG TPA_asm: hypothetical protein [Caudoviricetes sp.]
MDTDPYRIAGAKQLEVRLGLVCKCYYVESEKKS